jgi:hypothetical protein
MKKQDITIKAYIYFSEFLIDRDLKRLVSNFENLENEIKGNKASNKSLWFKFFKDDTLAATIHDIEYDFTGQHASNMIMHLLRIRGAVNNLTLRVFYS